MSTPGGIHRGSVRSKQTPIERDRGAIDVHDDGAVRPTVPRRPARPTHGDPDHGHADNAKEGLMALS